MKKFYVLWMLSVIFMVVMANTFCSAAIVIRRVGFEDGQGGYGIIPNPYGGPLAEVTTQILHSGKVYGALYSYKQAAYLSTFPISNNKNCY
jgi:hypothetical protein